MDAALRGPFARWPVKTIGLSMAATLTVVVSIATYDAERAMPTSWAGVVAYSGVCTLAWVERRWNLRRSAVIAAGSCAMTAAVAGIFGWSVPHAAWIGLVNVVLATAVAWAYQRTSSTADWFPDGPAHVVFMVFLCAAASVLAIVTRAVPYDWLGPGASAALTVQWVVRQTTHTLVGILTIFSLWYRPEPTYTRLEYRKYLPIMIPVGIGCQLISFFLPGYPVQWMVFIPAVLIGLTLTPHLIPTAACFMATIPMVFRDSPLWSTTPGRLLSPTTIMEALFSAAVTLSFVLVSLRERRARLAVQAREAAQREAAQAEMLRSVVQTITDGVLLTDAEGRIVVSNPAARAMLGRPGQEGPDGWAHRYAVRSASGAELSTEELHRLLDPPAEDPVRMTVCIPGAEVTDRRFFDVAAHRLVHRQDRLNLVLLTDVTAGQSRSRELESFAGTVAHDLKNPLAAVALWMDVAGEELARDPRQGAQALRQARDSSRRMSAMIDEYLTYTVTREGVLRPAPIDLDAVVRDVLRSDLCSQCEQAPVVRCAIEGVVRADRTLLVQLITNLVGNAVKYARPGSGARVTIRTASDVEPGWLRVLVEDEGVGFSAQEAQTIFQPFARTASGAAHGQGIGLGLALCHTIVSRHGGRITAYPNERGGATFDFTLPRADALVG